MVHQGPKRGRGLPYLDDFTQDQRELLVSLPYRAGLCVSECDLKGGEEAVVLEMQAMESLITGFAEDYLKSEFVESLMKETLARRERWPEWNAGLDSVPQECRQAVALLSERLDSKDVLSFRQNIMEIALSVAQAYGEEEGNARAGSRFPFQDRFDRLVKNLLKKEAAPARGRIALRNVSVAERQVLEAMSDALEVDFFGNVAADGKRPYAGA